MKKNLAGEHRALIGRQRLTPAPYLLPMTTDRQDDAIRAGRSLVATNV